MIRVSYTGAFLRQAKKLEDFVREDFILAAEEFKDRRKHVTLHVHKLHGELSGMYSFSINYHYRVVFEWVSKDEVLFHAVGNHDVYK